MLNVLNGLDAGKRFFDNVAKMCIGVLGILVLLSVILFWVLIGLYVQQYLDMSAFFLICFRFFIISLVLSASLSFILYCIHKLYMKKEMKRLESVILKKRNKDGRKK